VQLRLTFAVAQIPEAFAAVSKFVRVAGECDDAGRERCRDTRSADIGPAAVGAYVLGDAGATAGLGRDVRNRLAGAVRIVLPFRLRGGGCAARSGAVPGAFGKGRPGLF